MVDVGSLIIAHLVGDFLLQDDKIANNKRHEANPTDVGARLCFLHVFLYTMSFVFFTLGSWPVWAYLAIGIPHYIVDRYSLASKFMVWNGQSHFMKGPCSPWSAIVVDNTIHLVNAWLVWLVLQIDWNQAYLGISNVFTTF